MWCVGLIIYLCGMCFKNVLREYRINQYFKKNMCAHCVGMNMCVKCTYAWRSEVDTGGLLQSGSMLFLARLTSQWSRWSWLSPIQGFLVVGSQNLPLPQLLRGARNPNSGFHAWVQALYGKSHLSRPKGKLSWNNFRLLHGNCRGIKCCTNRTTTRTNSK